MDFPSGINYIPESINTLIRDPYSFLNVAYFEHSVDIVL